MINILIVDDENSVQFLYERIFKEETRENKIKLIFSLSGEEALEVMKSKDDINLVISDINMPGLSGFELLQKIKAISPDLPVFMSSAYSDTERQTLAKELGADDYIVKPVDFKALKEKINSI